MRLRSVPFEAPAHIGADWIEVKTILSAGGRFLFSDMERAWELNRESEDEDPGGGSESFDDWANARFAVMQRRLELLGPSYPFVFVEDDREFVYCGENGLRPGQVVYLLSLFLSVAPEPSIFESKIPITNWARDAFQACAGWAASGALEGSSYVIGWPRPDGSSFMTAMTQLFDNLMGDGEIKFVSTPPPGSPGREKDGGIDVIAWKKRIDGAGGKVQLFGQVASGQDWNNKPVGPYITALEKNWLVSPWVMPPIPGMFIPFSIVPVSAEVSYQEQIRFHAGMHGSMFYREVLAAYAQTGLDLHGAGAVVCHRADELPVIARRAKSLIQLLRSSQ